MSNGPDMTRLVSIPGDKKTIPHRAYPWSGVEPDGSTKWQIEYMQNPKDGYWGPRGSFTEKDGKFLLGDRTFDSAYLALRHKAYLG